MLIQRNQSGFALLIFMMVLISAYFLVTSGLLTQSLQQQNKEKRAKNTQLLNQAKEGLLSYSVEYLVLNDIGEMGDLPCPDVDNNGNNNGSSDVVCGDKAENSIGYFPYKSVGLGKIEDADKECFWYVVSGNYKDNPAYNLLNWDSTGLLNVVDENGDLQHGVNAEDFPIALIISPGKRLNQDRTPDLDKLADCRANYNVDSYLESGPDASIDYSQYKDDTQVGGTANVENTIWTFLQPSAASSLNDVNYNDQIVAIYKNELWDRVKESKQLNTADNDFAITKLTARLSECLYDYMTATSNIYNSNAVYPAKLNIGDLSNKTLYKRETPDLTASPPVPVKRYGRFPENIEDSELLDTDANDAIGGDPISTGIGNEFASSCVRSADNFLDEDLPLPDNAELNVNFWEKWKDHFFLVVADDFLPGNTITLASKCPLPPPMGAGTGECLSINGKDRVAAIIFFSGESVGNQDRALSAGTTDTLIWKQYFEGLNQNLYTGTNATNDFVITENEYAYCIVKDAGSNLSVEEC